MGGLGEATGHEGDHGPQDHGFVAGGQVLVIAGGAAVLADPGEGALDDPAAGQHLEGVQVAEQWPGRVAVLDGGGGDHYVQDQPGRVDGDVPFAAVDFLGVIPAPGG